MTTHKCVINKVSDSGMCTADGRTMTNLTLHFHNNDPVLKLVLQGKHKLLYHFFCLPTMFLGINSYTQSALLLFTTEIYQLQSSVEICSEVIVSNLSQNLTKEYDEETER